MLRRHLDATSPIFPKYRLQSKEDVGVTNLLTLGVTLIPNLVTRIEENLEKTCVQ